MGTITFQKRESFNSGIAFGGGRSEIKDIPVRMYDVGYEAVLAPGLPVPYLIHYYTISRSVAKPK